MLGSIIGTALNAVLNFIARLWSDKAAREAERDAGAEKQRADSLAKQVEEERDANAVRDAVRADIDRDPGRELRDEFFRD